MVTDSYPDHKGFQRLVVYDTITNKGLIIARFYAPFKGNPASCDLHPKLCHNNRLVVIDTAYDRQHHMVLFRLEWGRIIEALSA